MNLKFKFKNKFLEFQLILFLLFLFASLLLSTICISIFFLHYYHIFTHMDTVIWRIWFNCILEVRDQDKDIGWCLMTGKGCLWWWLGLYDDSLRNEQRMSCFSYSLSSVNSSINTRCIRTLFIGIKHHVTQLELGF